MAESEYKTVITPKESEEVKNQRANAYLKRGFAAIGIIALALGGLGLCDLIGDHFSQTASNKEGNVEQVAGNRNYMVSVRGASYYERTIDNVIQKVVNKQA